MKEKLKNLLSSARAKVAQLDLKLRELSSKAKNLAKAGLSGLLKGALASVKLSGKGLALSGGALLAIIKTILNVAKSTGGILLRLSPKLLAVGIAGYLALKAGQFLAVNMLDKGSKEVINNTVMVLAGRGGGTGIIVHSQDNESIVLTNNHVCEMLGKGGVVKTEDGKKHLVSTTQQYRLHDLCLISVKENLGQAVKFAEKAPEKGDYVRVSGHPALLPTVVTEGRVADNEIINVFMGFRPCTKEDMNKDPMIDLLCMFMGGLPVLKSYQATVMTATIMGGSSGSGVYNINNELEGVVFAGSGSGLSYAFTVPYSFLKDFIFQITSGKYPNNINGEAESDYSVDVMDIIGQTKTKTEQIRKFLQFCKTHEYKSGYINNVCSIVKRDVAWRNYGIEGVE